MEISGYPQYDLAFLKICERLKRIDFFQTIRQREGPFQNFMEVVLAARDNLEILSMEFSIFDGLALLLFRPTLLLCSQS
jgi:hypothetical protein